MASPTGPPGPSDLRPGAQPMLRFSLAIARCAAWIAPARDRERFRAEWMAELSYAARQSNRSSSLLLRRAAMALRDAVTLRGRRARGDLPASTPAPSCSRPRLWDELRQDVRFAVRSLWLAPGFAAITIATIAIGIGSTTTIFSLVDGILLKPLPYREPERLVAVWPQMHFSSHLFERIQPYLEAFDDFAAYSSWEYTWLGPDGAVRLRGPRATAGFFDVLGVPMRLGRGFREGDDAPGSTVVVLTEAFWRQRMGGAEDIIGATMRINGHVHTVIGVGGPSLAAIDPDADILMPWILDTGDPSYGSQEMKMIGRLRDGVGPQAALAEIGTFIDALQTEFELPPDFGHDATVIPLQEFLVGDNRSMLLLLFGAVGLTLLIAAANVASLLLTRALGRQRELAVRIAMGARSGRLVRQILTETTMLGLIGAIPGLALALYGVRAVVSLLPSDTPRLAAVGVDGSALLFSIGLALLVGWVVGIPPALHAARSDIRDALASGGRTGSDSRSRQRLRRSMVVAEVALAVTLVAGAGLLVKSFLRVVTVDPGFAPDGLVTFKVDPEETTVGSAAEAREYYRRMQERLASLPGVVQSSTVWKMAFNEDGGLNGFYRVDVPIDRSADAPLVRWRPVQQNYFATAGLRLQRGRLFGPDDAGGEPVGVVSQAAAEELFGAQDPIGQQVLTTAEDQVPVRVIGVVEDLKLAGLDRASPNVIYRPYAQLDGVIDLYGFYDRWVVLRTQGAVPPGLAATVRDAVRNVDPTALFDNYVTMPTAIRNSLSGREAMVTLLSFFAISAVILGAIGIYGVMAFTVRQREREIGIRFALGASRERIINDVLLEGLKVAGMGAVVGLLLTIGLARTVREFLFQVDAFDPWILAIAATSALLVSALASLWPALRAARADPARALATDA